MGLMVGVAAVMGTIAQIAPLSTTELASQLGRLEQRFEERLSKLETENKLLRAQLPQLHDASTQLPEFSSTMRTFGTVVCNATEVIGGRKAALAPSLPPSLRLSLSPSLPFFSVPEKGSVLRR